MKTTNRKRRGVLAVLALLAALASAVTPLTPAKATSGFCGDAWPNPHVQLVSGDVGGIDVPLWLGVESGALSGTPGHVRLCYATGAPGDNKTFGGSSYVTLPVAQGNNYTAAGTESDGNAAAGATASASTAPTYTVAPGGTSGGQVLTFTIPASVCVGPCVPGTQPLDGTSGVIVGTLTRTPSGGTSAAYRVDNLCVKVDGATVLGNCQGTFLNDTGATTTGTTPVSVVPGTPGPCVVGVCAPSFDSIGTSGRQLGTLYVPGLGAIPVYGVHTCLYQKNAGTTCPS